MHYLQDFDKLLSTLTNVNANLFFLIMRVKMISTFYSIRNLCFKKKIKNNHRLEIEKKENKGLYISSIFSHFFFFFSRFFNYIYILSWNFTSNKYTMNVKRSLPRRDAHDLNLRLNSRDCETKRHVMCCMLLSACSCCCHDLTGKLIFQQ